MAIISARSDVTTRLRLVSGIILMTFTSLHLVNHALALHSIAAAEAGRAVFLAIWRSPPGTIALYGALLCHVVLAAHKIYRRRSLRMPFWEALQVLLGIAIPFWLIAHVLGTRVMHEVFGLNDDYVYIFSLLWPNDAVQQAVMVMLVWLHGCIGTHFWLRLKPWYRRLRPLFLALALWLPMLGLAGFFVGGRETALWAQINPDWSDALAAAGRWPRWQDRIWMYQVERNILQGFSLLLLGAIAGRIWLAWRSRFGSHPKITYPDGTTVAIRPGMSVLEASHTAGIPHASVCGGRGRCSTCRVWVRSGGEHLEPPAPDEIRVLQRIGAIQGIRLACQLRPGRDLFVVPLLPASAKPEDADTLVNPASGVEREIAVMFADMRAFTRMSEGRLPYDIVFVLNRYFEAMGQPIESAGGRVDKFLGDGIMALFGVDDEPSRACHAALEAARAMAAALERLNREISDDLRQPIRIGIGLHVGPVILGEMGYGKATSLTAIGDAVNVAARLEVLTKELNVQLLVSAELVERAGVEMGSADVKEVEIRGRRQPLRVYPITDASSLQLDGGNGGRSQPAASWFARRWYLGLKGVSSGNR